MKKLKIFLHFFLISILSINCQQLQWILLSDGSSGDTPMPRRDAALGFDSTFLILYGGRDQSGMPLQDTYAFNVLQGLWEPLNFPNAPPSRYGMASASSIGAGLYVFGGFGMQGSSQFYNPYTAYGTSGLASYKQNPAGADKQTPRTVNKRNTGAINKQSQGVNSKQNFNQMNPMGYNNYNDNDDRADENYYALSDAWFLNYVTKSWQQTQTSQYGRGFGSAAATPYSSGIPRVIYSMGKSHDWMYSTVETTGQVTSGFNQAGSGPTAIIMYDLSSYNPSYPHARYGHSTTLLTDNHLLLYGGCLSGYGKGGPCPSKDTWLLHVDRGHWERLWECPPTKTGAAMVTLPSYSTCASIGQGVMGGWPGMSMGNEPPVAVLWGGREFNPSSIRSYLSPPDEVAVFSLTQKEWLLKSARPSTTDNSFPMQREGAAVVAGCFQGSPGMFVYGGRSVTNDRRLLSDLWFLKASAQDALSSPRRRGCIYPFSYYHLHGIFQFFTYGVIFPIGYIVGRHVKTLPIKRPLHMSLQLFGVALAICGFAFGVHSVRAPSWLHFKHAHAIIGIITFILTILQFLAGLVGFIFLNKENQKNPNHNNSDHKFSSTQNNDDKWGGEGVWRIGHRILGLLILALGLVNISLGVFLAVLPLPVWIIWYIYFGFLVLLLIGMEIVALLSRNGSRKSKSTTRPEKREDPKGTSQSSLTYTNEPTKHHHTTEIHQPRYGINRGPPPEPARRGAGTNGDDKAPLIPNQRQHRPGDVNSSASLPQYNRPNEREYPARKRSEPSESGGFDYYVGYPPEQEQSLPRSTIQQQSEHNLTRIRLQ
ncbi:unnamed protein product [Rotaria socialis]|uniref:Cytochrome b561 domain-containing protein n=6 Tax=Rotaria socialis TaxID=392032 RepID=A0A817ZKQ4_9BILA|nr:unnamed protein product [Rotaria socialis]CAF3394409.1 unnamed protein product [Rotaria socialis]CAF3437140.1 unnamed protein product [Rotaria socialis]CAF4230045.1 unnamed protein product [Rotaria socialis]